VVTGGGGGVVTGGGGGVVTGGGGGVMTGGGGIVVIGGGGGIVETGGGGGGEPPHEAMQSARVVKLPVHCDALLDVVDPPLAD
jgi:hypothetical protein